MNLRIGQGYDIHRTAPGRPLVLGGVVIPSSFGLLGHSDADALLHAVIDALLGALALGDIGAWFPDTEAAYRGADSRELLQCVLRDPAFHCWHIVNLDCTVFAEAPKLSPLRDSIRASLATLLGTEVSRISFKAKTNEKLDCVGAGLAIAAAATVLLEHNDR